MRLIDKQIIGKWHEFMDVDPETEEEVLQARIKIRPFPVSRSVWKRKKIEEVDRNRPEPEDDSAFPLVGDLDAEEGNCGY